MSKSLGNTVAPAKIYQQYGADILRLWVAATDFRGEMTVSDEIFKRVADAYRRIRNTARFILANLNGFEPGEDALPVNQLLALDYWIVRQCQLLQAEVVNHYHSYNFLSVYQKIHNFCVTELGGFYLDVIKDRQYTTQVDSRARRSTQTAMLQVVEMLSRMIAPILSFTADEIWQHIPGERVDSVFLSDFEEGHLALEESGEFDDSFWRRILEVKTAVNRELEVQRAEKTVGSGLSAEVDLFCDGQLADDLARLGEELRFVLIVSRASVNAGTHAPEQAVATEVAGLSLRVTASEHEKCERCWHHREDVGQDAAHAGLCLRCVSNVAGDGELRRFA